jgi:hypothetical protein
VYLRDVMAEFFIDDEKSFVPLQYRDAEKYDQRSVPKIWFNPVTLEDRQKWRRQDQIVQRKEEELIDGELERLSELLHGRFVEIEVQGEPGARIKIKVAPWSHFAPKDEAPSEDQAEVEASAKAEEDAETDSPSQEPNPSEEEEEAFEDPDLFLEEVELDAHGHAHVQWAPRRGVFHVLEFEDVKHHLALAMKYVTRLSNFTKRSEGSNDRVPVIWREESEEYRQNGVLLRLGDSAMMLKNLVSLGYAIAEGLDAEEKKT